MLKKFTAEQMLDYWKRRMGLISSFRAVGERNVTDVDLKLMEAIECWYSEVLHSAPPEKVPVEDVAADVEAHYLTENSAELLLPERGVRFVSVKMQEWEVEETETVSPWSDAARLQRNKLTRATVDDPLVVQRTGRLIVHGLRTPQLSGEVLEAERAIIALLTPTVEKLEMVVRPADGSFVLDPSILRHEKLYFD